MNAGDSNPTSDQQRLIVEETLERFEKSLRRSGRIEIEEWLPREPPELRRILLWEMLHADLEYAIKQGRDVRVEDYTLQFPEMDEEPGSLADLVIREFRLRQRYKQAVSVADVLRRFPQLREALQLELGTTDTPASPLYPMRLNCPSCKEPVSQGALTGDRITCPACGETFEVQPDPSVTWNPARLPRLGKFQLLEVVGRGTFGAVYRAHDTQLDRIVAVKVPRSGAFTSADDEERFVREAISVARLSHSGVVPVYEVGRTPEFPYIVAEFVDGITLEDALTRDRMPFRCVAELIADIAVTLDHVHRNGIVHRDLKPSNVILQSTGREADGFSSDPLRTPATGRGSGSDVRENEFRPRLMDFGLARRDDGTATLTLDNQIVGTPAYMSPEQAEGGGHRVDGRADTYSLGVMLYQLLSGELPFRGNARMLRFQVLHEEPTPPRQLNDGIPRDLETICLKAMQKDPSRRFQTAGEMAGDLHRFLRGEPILARPVSRIERLWRFCRRNSVATTLAGFAAVSLIAGAAASLYFAIDAHNRESEALVAQKHLQVELLQNALSEELKETDFGEPGFARLEAMVEQIRELSSESALKAVDSINRAYAVRIRAQIRDPGGLSGDDRRTIAAAIDTLKQRNPELARSLIQQFEEVSRSPTRLFSFPENPQADLPASMTEVQRSEHSVIAVRTQGPDADPRLIVPIYSAVATDINMSVTFDLSRWNRRNPFGVVLGHQDGHTQAVRSVCWKDADTFFSCGNDSMIACWNANTGALQRISPVYSGTRSLLCCSGNGRYLFVAEGTAGGIVLDSVTMHPVPGLEIPNHRILAAVGAPDASAFLLSSREAGIIRADPESSSLTALIPAQRTPFSSIDISADGEQILTGDARGRIRLWKTGEPEPVQSFDASRSLVVRTGFLSDRDTAFVVTANGNISLLNRNDLQVLRQESTGRHFVSAAASPDGSFLATGGDDGSLQVWSTATLELQTNKACHDGPVFAVEFAPDSGAVATAGEDLRLQLRTVPLLNDVFTRQASGYQFVVLPSLPQADPFSLSDSNPQQVDNAELQIRRNGVLLQKIPYQIPRNSRAGTIRASQNGEELMVEFTDAGAIRFRDVFPLYEVSRGAFAVIWPASVGVTRIEAMGRDLSLGATPAISAIGKADAEFATRHYRVALELYREIERQTNSDLARQEAVFKQAMCLVRLQEKDAQPTFVRLFNDRRIPNSPWPPAAGCQAWLDHLRTGNLTEADSVLAQLESSFTFEQLASLLPEKDRQQIVLTYVDAGLNGAFDQIKPHPERQKNLERVLRLHQLVAVGPVELFRTREALVRAYFEQQRNTEALEISSQILASPPQSARDLDLVLMVHTWILLEMNNPEQALRDLDRFLLSEDGSDRAGLTSLRIERARTLAGMGRPEDALHDIERVTELRVPEELSVDNMLSARVIEGFLREELGDSAGAMSAWQAGLETARSFTDFANTMDFSILASVTGELTRADAVKLVELTTNASGDSEVMKFIRFSLAENDITYYALKNLWISERGRSYAKRIALQQLPYDETMYCQVLLTGHEVWRRAMTNEFEYVPLDPERDTLVWNNLVRMFKEFREETLAEKHILTMALVHMNIVNTWTTDRKDVDPAVRATIDYIHGVQYGRHLNQPEKARQYLDLARADAIATGDDSLVRLIDRELEFQSQAAAARQ